MPHADAVTLVRLICGNAAPTVQVFADTTASAVRPDHKTASLPQLWRWIEAAQADGAGVFLTVNRTDPGYRTAASVREVRALFVDCDGVEPSEWHLPPSIVVQSVHGKHAYWLTADCPLASFTESQKRLAAHYGSDPKVADLPRVMRLCGTWHQKGERKMVALLDAPGHRYIAADILADIAQFAPPPPKPRAPERAPMAMHAKGQTLDYATFDALRWAQEYGCYLSESPRAAGKHFVTCPWVLNHTGQRQGNSATMLFVGGERPGFWCNHASCAGRTIRDIRDLLTDDDLARYCGTKPNQQWRRVAVAVNKAEAKREAIQWT